MISVKLEGYPFGQFVEPAKMMGGEKVLTKMQEPDQGDKEKRPEVFFPLFQPAGGGKKIEDAAGNAQDNPDKRKGIEGTVGIRAGVGSEWNARERMESKMVQFIGENAADQSEGEKKQGKDDFQ